MLEQVLNRYGKNYEGETLKVGIWETLVET